MILVGLGAAILTIFAAGFGVTLSIFARTNRFNLVECACLSWLLGSGIISLLLWIGGTFCSGLVLHAVVMIACLVLAMFGWREMQNAAARSDFSLPKNLVEWVLATIVVVAAVILLFLAFKNTL